MLRRSAGRSSRQQPQSRESDDPQTSSSTPPTEDEWRLLTKYKSFVAYSDDGEQFKFNKDGFALLAPAGFTKDTPLWTYHVAQILEIRGNHPDHVWVRVKWYYSAGDTGLDPKSYSKYERFISNHYDIEHHSTFESAISRVVKLDDQALDSPPIGKHTFFYRHRFDHVKERVHFAPPAPCLCDKPFNPDLAADIMHFCPRPQCRRAYHVRCLDALFPSSEARKKEVSLDTYLVCSPDSDTPVAMMPTLVDHDDADANVPPRKRRRVRFSDQVGQLKPDLEIVQARTETSATCETPTLPADLLHIARCPIVRGKNVGGPSGNVRGVVAARRLVYATAQGAPLPRDWQAHVDFEHSLRVADSIGDMQGDSAAPFRCPNCGGPI